MVENRGNCDYPASSAVSHSGHLATRILVFDFELFIDVRVDGNVSMPAVLCQRIARDISGKIRGCKGGRREAQEVSCEHSSAHSSGLVFTEDYY